jgi:hypothetical protein
MQGGDGVWLGSNYGILGDDNVVWLEGLDMVESEKLGAVVSCRSVDQVEIGHLAQVHCCLLVSLSL